MNKYEQLMAEIIEFLEGTWLAGPRGHIPDYGPIRGCTEDKLQDVEKQIGRPLPLALRAWYAVAGEVPPYLGDHDATYSINALLSAYELAPIVMDYETCQWTLTPDIIPFLPRVGTLFVFVDTSKGDPDDPFVHSYFEGEALPRWGHTPLSAHLRNVWIAWLDESQEEWSKHSRRQDWAQRRPIFEGLQAQARQLRSTLTEIVYAEDQAAGCFTGPRRFQERWIEVFSKTDTWKHMEQEGFQMPWGWVDPPQKSR